ncbi:hypothetical protein [Phenylobacterium sp.]|nr:hypothetical protein [Phenylobacterium sp.]
MRVQTEAYGLKLPAPADGVNQCLRDGPRPTRIAGFPYLTRYGLA